MKQIKKWFTDSAAFLIILAVGLLCAGFILAGTPAEDGSITLDGKNAQISQTTKDWIEDANEAMARIMNKDIPTDDATVADNDEPMGKGFYVDIPTILSRIEPDGNDDGGKKWQCSKYTAYLATGKREYSTAHTDYGPVNGKAVAEWLVKNYGFKYIDKPVKGAIGSGGFNTQYGHTALYLYSTGTNTAMVNDANWTPLKVATHNMNISGWVWVVPGNYEPTPEPTPTPTPTPQDEITYTYQYGDTFGRVLTKLGLGGNDLWGENGAVRYYTRQLIEQDMLDINGNVRVGVPFILKK